MCLYLLQALILEQALQCRIDYVKCESVTSRLLSVTGLYCGRLTVRGELGERG